MQEEVTQKTIALVIKTAKLDANVLKAAMRMYLNHRRQKAQKMHGKTSVKKLVGEGVGVSSANYAQTECQFRYCGTAIPFLTVRSTAR